MPNNPTWIEPPPQKKSGLGCFGKGCLGFVAVCLLAILLLGVGGYFFFSRGFVAAQPTPMPVEELAPDALSNVQERVREFKSTPPAPPPAAAGAANETPTPAPAPGAPERQLVVTAAEINGLIAANKKSRGHAFVTLSGNTATVQISISSDKVPGLPRGYLNGNFNITTAGPTAITALKVSKIEANGWSVPSGVLSMSYRGRSIMGYALEATAPYKVSTVEVQDGRVIVR
jgi:hypothetical protein